MTSAIELLLEQPPAASVEILQLFEHLELLRAGKPAHNTLFILGRTQLSVMSIDENAPDHLILVNPPPDATDRFRLGENTAAIFTATAMDNETSAAALPLVQTIPGGVAHIRVGNHFVDVYAQRSRTIVHLPAVGVLYGGDFGSDATVPTLAPTSDGTDELDTLRLLASLVKQSRLQLYIPHVGELSEGVVPTIERLAADVSYLHTLRRVIPGIVQRGDPEGHLLGIADSLLPQTRQNTLSTETHLKNLSTLFHTLKSNIHNG